MANKAPTHIHIQRPRLTTVNEIAERYSTAERTERWTNNHISILLKRIHALEEESKKQKDAIALLTQMIDVTKLTQTEKTALRLLGIRVPTKHK